MLVNVSHAGSICRHTGHNKSHSLTTQAEQQSKKQLGLGGTGLNAKQFLENVVDLFVHSDEGHDNRHCNKDTQGGWIMCASTSAGLSLVLFALLLARSICVCQCDGSLPVCVDCTQISDRAARVQATVAEGEFVRAINSRVLFHSVTGQLCQGEDVAQDPNCITDMLKEN